MGPNYIYRFKAFDFTVNYNYRPNEDIYTETLPKELNLSAVVPTNFDQLTFEEQKLLLEDVVIEELVELIEFDTDDAPEFEISDIDFCFETRVDD